MKQVIVLLSVPKQARSQHSTATASTSATLISPVVTGTQQVNAVATPAAAAEENSSAAPSGLAREPASRNNPAAEQQVQRRGNHSLGTTTRPRKLVRETIADGRVLHRETLVVGGGPVTAVPSQETINESSSEEKAQWTKQFGNTDAFGRDEETVVQGEHLCTLLPGAMATFEVAATAPEDCADGSSRMQVKSPPTLTEM